MKTLHSTCSKPSIFASSAIISSRRAFWACNASGTDVRQQVHDQHGVIGPTFTRGWPFGWQRARGLPTRISEVCQRLMFRNHDVFIVKIDSQHVAAHKALIHRQHGSHAHSDHVLRKQLRNMPRTAGSANDQPAIAHTGLHDTMSVGDKEGQPPKLQPSRGCELTVGQPFASRSCCAGCIWTSHLADPTDRKTTTWTRPIQRCVMTSALLLSGQ